MVISFMKKKKTLCMIALFNKYLTIYSLYNIFFCLNLIVLCINYSTKKTNNNDKINANRSTIRNEQILFYLVGYV